MAKAKADAAHGLYAVAGKAAQEHPAKGAKGLSGLYLKVDSANSKLRRVVRIPNPSAARGYRLKKFGTKIDQVSAPPSKTCPPCPLKGNGCFPALLPEARKLELACKDKNADTIMAEVVADIRTYAKADGRWLRLWANGGDFLSAEWAGKIRDAVSATYGDGGGRAFGFTRTWKQLPRSHLGDLSVLASLNNPGQIALARERGFAPAIIVEEFPEGGNEFQIGDHLFIPCRQEIDGTPCTDCGFCQTDEALFAAKRGIAFRAHGSQSKKTVVAVGSHFQPLVALRSPRVPPRTDLTITYIAKGLPL
jgi:hypothetical protein